MTGLKSNLKQTLEIAESTADPRIKLQARAIANDVAYCYKYIMDLTINGVVETDAIKYVNSRMDHLNESERKLLQDIKDKGDIKSESESKDIGEENSSPGLEEQPTHNGTF